MPAYVNYALVKANKTLLVITQDEKTDGVNGYCGDANHIILFLISGDLQPPQADSARQGLDTGQAAQYNILKTITKNFGLGNLNHATGNGVQVLIPPITPPP
jgi:hypothetical protein